MKRHLRSMKDTIDVSDKVKAEKVKPLTSSEVDKYAQDIATSLGIDLSKADYDETQRLLRKVSSLSQEIVKHRRQ
jgi:hypothetical protein